MTTRSRGKMLGKWRADRLATGECLDNRTILGCRRGCILGGGCFQFLELQFHLVDHGLRSEVASTFG
jgi:hypothetical protein